MNTLTVALSVLVVSAAFLSPLPGYAQETPAPESRLAPHIERTIPARFVAERRTSEGETEVFLTGERLARPDTTPESVAKDVQVQVRLNETDSPVAAAVTAATGDTLRVRLPSKPLLLSAGRLEFLVTVRGVGESNRLTVPVLPYPTEKPVIESLTVAIPRRAPGSKTPGRLEQIQVRQLAPDAEVRVEGTACKITRVYPGDGHLEFVLPEEIESKAGRYAVTVSTSIGVSEPAYFEVVSPPSIVEFRPYSLTPLAKEAKEETVSVTVLHEGSLAPSPWIRFIPEAPATTAPNTAGEPVWESVSAVELKPGICVLTLPRKWLALPGTLAVRLVTVGGESVGYLPVIPPP